MENRKEPQTPKIKPIKAFRGELLPPSVRKATTDFVRKLKRHKIKHLVVGAVPVQFYGRERFSRDVDFVVFLNEKNAAGLFKLLKTRLYKVRFPLPYEHRLDKPYDLLNWHLLRLEDSAHNALLDIHLKPESLGLDKKSLNKAKIVMLNDEKIAIPSVEDYLITKLISRRPSSHDFEDTMSTLIRQYGKIDWEYLKNKAEKYNLLFLLKYYKEAVKNKMKRRKQDEE